MGQAKRRATKIRPRVVGGDLYQPAVVGDGVVVEQVDVDVYEKCDDSTLIIRLILISK